MKDTLSLVNPRFHATAQGFGAIILRAWILMVVLDPRVRSVFPTVLMFQRQEMGIHVPAKVLSLEYQGWMAVVVHGHRCKLSRARFGLTLAPACRFHFNGGI